MKWSFNCLIADVLLFSILFQGLPVNGLEHALPVSEPRSLTEALSGQALACGALHHDTPYFPDVRSFLNRQAAMTREGADIQKEGDPSISSIDPQLKLVRQLQSAFLSDTYLVTPDAGRTMAVLIVAGGRLVRSARGQNNQQQLLQATRVTLALQVHDNETPIVIRLYNEQQDNMKRIRNVSAVLAVYEEERYSGSESPTPVSDLQLLRDVIGNPRDFMDLFKTATIEQWIYGFALTGMFSRPFVLARHMQGMVSTPDELLKNIIVKAWKYHHEETVQAITNFLKFMNEELSLVISPSIFELGELLMKFSALVPNNMNGISSPSYAHHATMNDQAKALKELSLLQENGLIFASHPLNISYTQIILYRLTLRSQFFLKLFRVYLNKTQQDARNSSNTNKKYEIVVKIDERWTQEFIAEGRTNIPDLAKKVYFKTSRKIKFYSTQLQRMMPRYKVAVIAREAVMEVLNESSLIEPDVHYAIIRRRAA